MQVSVRLLYVGDCPVTLGADEDARLGAYPNLARDALHQTSDAAGLEVVEYGS